MNFQNSKSCFQSIKSLYNLFFRYPKHSSLEDYTFLSAVAEEVDLS